LAVASGPFFPQFSLKRDHHQKTRDLVQSFRRIVGSKRDSEKGRVSLLQLDAKSRLNLIIATR
jgi:hypothetical protein